MNRLAILLVLFSSTAWAQQTPVNASRGSCGDPKTTFDAQPASSATPAQAGIQPGKAQVLVIQAQEDEGFCIHCGLTVKVGMDSHWIGATNHNSFLSFAVDPGDHHLCVNWQSKIGRRSKLFSLVSFTAEPGKTYYFRTHIAIETEHRPEIFSLEPVNADEGKYLAATSVPSEFKQH